MTYQYILLSYLIGFSADEIDITNINSYCNENFRNLHGFFITSTLWHEVISMFNTALSIFV